jgi:lysophospholipase L1-like esterase
LDSPDFYALSLEGNSGVMVDNIALRGSSGTFFQHINLEQLKAFYNYLDVKLIILQFGGNAIPSLVDQSMAVNYGNYLRYQIKLVKKAAPDVSILFIGPSDMNIKEGMEYITYPMLESVRDEIKKAVLESGCAFFDLYDCMGGKNSMAAWVEQNLAASDYTHFSPQGARKMATMLYAALINEYNAYLKNEKK